MFVCQLKKMKPFLILCFLVLNPLINTAQNGLCMCKSKDTSKRYRQYEVGISAIAFDNYKPSKFLFNGIMIKKHFDNFTVRVGANFFNTTFDRKEEDRDGFLITRNKGKLISNSFRVGIQKNLFESKLTPFLSLDFIYSISDYSGKSEVFNGVAGYSFADYTNKVNSFGLNPAFGLRYRPFQIVSVSIETGVNFDVGFSKYKDQSGYQRKSTGNNLAFLKYGLLTVNIHLFH